jgi:hypothetical protein
MSHYQSLTTATAVLLLAGCSVNMSPAASKIQVHSQLSTALDSCKKIGPVTGTITKRFWRPSDRFLSGAIREEASNLGADTVLLLQQDLVGSQYIQHGVAYKCY